MLVEVGCFVVGCVVGHYYGASIMAYVKSFSKKSDKTHKKG